MYEYLINERGWSLGVCLSVCLSTDLLRRFFSITYVAQVQHRLACLYFDFDR